MERLINRIYKLRFFSWLIAFFLGGILYTITCHAQSMPSLSSNTFSVIQGGNNSLFSSGFGSVDVFPYTNDPINVSQVITSASKNPLIIGAELSAVSNTDYDVRKLSEEEIKNNKNVYPYLYDVNGNIVNWNNVYFVHYDNGYCHGELYVDSNGEILTSDEKNTYSMFQLGYGGYKLGVSELANIYSDIALQLGNCQMLYALDSDIDISNNVMNFYVFGGNRGNYNGSIPYYLAQELYIPNIYDRNLFYVGSSPSWKALSLNTPTQIYCVNYPAKYLKTIYNQHGNNYPLYNIQSTNYTKDGITYNYLINCPNAYAFTVNSSLTSKENFLSDSNLQIQYSVLNYNKFNYDPNLCYFEDEILAFKVLQPKTGKIIQINDDEYSYNDIKELEQNLNDINSSPNELFDPDKSISEENYPLNYPYDEPSVNPSDLPFPIINNPEEVPESNPEVNPSIENPYPDVNPSEINNTIPIISGLQNKFPFSIPWDIYNLIKGLSVPRETPVLNFEITFPVINYTWNPVIDLSMYDSTAELFRTLFLIIFIIGLAVFSYNHFFGS